jgi:hypothetical protein
MREALLLSEIAKPINDIKNSDLKFVKSKMENLDRKYGRIPKEQLEAGEGEDKGRVRYDRGAYVECVLPNDSEIHPTNTICDSVETGRTVKPATRTDRVFVPGRGVISRADLSMD